MPPLSIGLSGLSQFENSEQTVVCILFALVNNCLHFDQLSVCLLPLMAQALGGARRDTTISFASSNALNMPCLWM